MKSHSRLSIRAALIAMVGACLLISGQAHAQAGNVTPNSPCGAEATGYMDDGRLWSGIAPRMQVGPLPDANWHRCQDWVKDGEVARPADLPKPQPCRGVDRSTWTIDDKTCTSSIPPAAHGFSALSTVEMGPMRGQATYVCKNGTFSIDAARSHCEDAPGCDLEEVIRFGNMGVEACKATIDSRGAGRRPIGYVTSMPADALPGWAGSITLQCAFGRWQTMDSICIKTQK